MDTVRYILALLVVVCLPPAVLLWLVIHPFARFWRRLGRGWTYVILSGPLVGTMVGLYWARRALVGADLGSTGGSSRWRLRARRCGSCCCFSGAGD